MNCQTSPCGVLTKDLFNVEAIEIFVFLMFSNYCFLLRTGTLYLSAGLFKLESCSVK